MHSDLWTYRDEIEGRDVVDFDVEAKDGDIGKIDSASYETDSGYIVVDTGFWIFGQKSLLPAAAIESVDEHEWKVFVNRTKEEIKNAPQFNPDQCVDADARVAYDHYYGGLFGYYTVP